MPQNQATRPRKAKPATLAREVVGQQVRALRKQRDLSQDELAKKVPGGMLQQTLAKLENGKRAVTVEDLFRLAAALDVAPVELLAGGFTGADVPIDEAGEQTLPSEQARRWIAGAEPLPGADRELYFRQTGSAQRLAETIQHSGLGLAMMDIEGWYRGAMAGDLDQQESYIRLIAERARTGLRDLQLRHSQEYYKPSRVARRRRAGWADDQP